MVHRLLDFVVGASATYYLKRLIWFRDRITSGLFSWKKWAFSLTLSLFFRLLY